MLEIAKYVLYKLMEVRFSENIPYLFQIYCTTFKVITEEMQYGNIIALSQKNAYLGNNF